LAVPNCRRDPSADRYHPRLRRLVRVLVMPFPFSVFLFSYVIWQASIERAFDMNPFEVRYARTEDL